MSAEGEGMAASVISVTHDVEADEWAAIARNRIRAETESLDATRRRTNAEANLRKQALMRADADAQAEQLARERLEAIRASIEQYRLLELAENEAAAVAKIKADAERALTAQEQARADAERASELAAIAKQQMENEAAQQARRHAEAEVLARANIEARLAAERAAEAAAAERLATSKRLASERGARLKAQIELARVRRSRLGLMAARLRHASPLTIGAAALLFGCGIGAWLAFSGQLAPPSENGWLSASDAPGVEIRLKLDQRIPHFDR